MPNKKKYNVNGDSGMKAQVRAGVLRDRNRVFFLLKTAFVSLASAFFVLPSLFPPNGSFPSVGGNPNLQRDFPHFLSGVMECPGKRCSRVVFPSGGVNGVGAGKFSRKTLDKETLFDGSPRWDHLESSGSFEMQR